VSAAAIIPNWNGAKRLPRVLDDLKAQSMLPAETLVVDNGSTDGSDALAEQAGAKVVRLGSNTGFARAVNLGVQATSAPLVAVLNNDLELPPDWLATLHAALDDGASFATGKLLSARDPTRIDGAFDAVSRACCPWRCGQGRADSELWSQPREVRMASMTATLYRRRLFQEVGPLDERFESYLEDTDFAIRCALAGHTGRYAPQAVARHWGSATLGVWHPETVRLLARNQVFLAAKHYSRNWTAGAAWRVVVGQLLWGMVTLRHRAFGPYMRGKWEGLRRAPEFGAPDARIGWLLAESEALIHELQRASGMDPYWRLYFALAW
jgi:GT2 family glycosyltransferase